MGQIVYSEAFRCHLDELTQRLYQLGYFGFIEDADEYIDRIYDFINENIEKPIIKKSPDFFFKFGEFYLKYPANSRTTWYIFFDRKTEKILVKHILNNHHPDFPELFQD